ncbi:follicular lymphoma variant translocation 1 [Thecamonas trahens ATCC 50062]|uniref:3-dehydrosphinganine reductase n=1 Tax=Thecamonas trahens ATCC 50062 TaxID=461836 RepID=A0A0L0DJ98_THETB|nr:follicular lymphoma variant translocation 1 [Thecamonas trahens ATCC 50062]KNC52280.1 follicular lymphoma variant translocation 1 [Thecamonas trahens ATCC 50062]|eukprot:XP_013762279.1 follicular lymphoma variant translocation 1 [Thecamonas trahens ATCC 50062]
MEYLSGVCQGWASPSAYSWPGLALTGLAAGFALQQLARTVVNSVTSSALDLSGKHVVITGGSEGMGLAFAKLAVGDGASVTILARNQAKLDKALDELTAIVNALPDPVADQFVDALSVDVTDGEAVTRAMAEVDAKAPVELLIANAGYSATGYFMDLEESDFTRSMDVNYMGVVRCAKAIVPSMIARRSGHIAIISSAMAMCGMLGYTAYAPTKWALRGFADSLRQELLPFDVSVSICYPSDVETPGFAIENETKPPETVAMSDSGELLTAEQAAGVMYPRIRAREFHIGTDLLLDMMSWPMAAMSPRSNTVLAIAASPLVSFLTAVVGWQWDGIVHSHASDRSDVRTHASPLS